MPSPHRLAHPLAYETSAFELSPDYPINPTPWSLDDLAKTIRKRCETQKSRREIHINYYRIGHPLAFPLPVERRYTSTDLPAGISGMEHYPWLIWLCWELEERWRIFHAAWRQFGDHEAAALLQSELAALAQWDHFHETHNEVGLVTAHLAAVLALTLADESGWDATHLAAAQTAADALLNRDVAPWFAQQWAKDEPLTQQRIHNIPVLALTRSAQLARVRDDALTDTLDSQAQAVLEIWARFRTGPERHTEGTAYDGYFMDAMTGWLAALPHRDALLAETKTAFRNLTDQWMQLTLPGRLDLHVPLSDTEQRMPFWTNALHRLAIWYEWPDVSQLLLRVPTNRLPAAILVEVSTQSQPEPTDLPAPTTTFHEHPHALTLRSGWSSDAFLVTIGAARSPLHHLHHDGGHLILGWQARFWITDPGYQQYREGEERDYSIGIAAHNAPVIKGIAQSLNTTRILNADSPRQARLDLTGCYSGLPPAATVRRSIRVADSVSPLVIVRDQFTGFEAGTTVTNHWLGGTHFAWAFVDGWARLSDGKHAFWIGATHTTIAPADLIRHDGSRGPLTLKCESTLENGSAEQTWVFWGDVSGGWQRPKLTQNEDTLMISLSETNASITFR